MNRYTQWLETVGNDIITTRRQPQPQQHTPDADVQETSGPGSVLLTMFSYIGIKASIGCACRRHAKVMDHKGTGWCISNINTIVGWLAKEATVRKLPFFHAGVRIALAGLLRGYALKESLLPGIGGAPFSALDAEWAVAVTTAPRTPSTLEECLDSIITAGWYDPVVFAEPGVTAPSGVTVIQNETKLGCWHNWLHSARHTLQNTTASFILCAQDDALFHPDSREFVESYCLRPAEDTGMVSLYTAAHYSEQTADVLRPPGINHIHTKSLWGTCAVVWRRDVLQAVVDHELAKTWCGVPPRKTYSERINPQLRADNIEKFYAHRRENPATINNSDVITGRILNHLGLKMFFVDPSPVQHIAATSTLQHGGNTGRRNCKRCADHTIPLAAQVGNIVHAHDGTPYAV